MSETAIEQIYQKKTQLEHILLRPDTYVGSCEHIDEVQWVLGDNQKFVNKKIRYVPGLYKIFDEILVNASDNYQRDRRMTQIRVNIDKSSNKISIWNNGKGIPVEIHKEHSIYVPELIFGHLLTSSNYNDSEKKVTGGRNGFGAKLTNIFAKSFKVETLDSKKKRKFEMVWSKNMKEKSDAIITSVDGALMSDYTVIEFEPDLKLFGMKRLEDDIVALMQKRVYDQAGVLPKSVSVYLNGKQLKVNGFEEYTKLYQMEDEENNIRIYDKIGTRWEVVFSLSEGKFRQVSFVNGICTSAGGTHVNVISDQIVDYLIKNMKKKDTKDCKIENYVVKNNLWIFVNCQIENPAFSSQTKETMTLKPDKYGSDYTLSEKYLKLVAKSGVLDHIIAQVRAKAKVLVSRALSSKKKTKVLNVPKLEDANWAGTARGKDCILILTEGDSAKALAMAGLDVVGRDRFGIFPLKGKLLNVRDATPGVLKNNDEIQNVVKILGLTFDKQYTEDDRCKMLRYGKVMIMADQDHDGSHIKGLVINYFHYFWPS
jgi:DNA topoisomerase-2